MQWYNILDVYERRMMALAIRCIDHPRIFSNIPLSMLIT